MELPFEFLRELAIGQGHSNDYIKDIEAYFKIIDSKGLPVIFSPFHLSQLLGISYNRLLSMVNETSIYYKTFKLRKKTGGYRWISVPDEELKIIHRRLNKMIFEIIKPSISTQSFIKKSSIRTNAIIHANAKTCLNVDLYRFYESVSDKRIYGYLHGLGYHPNVAYTLAQLVTIKLPKGYWQEVRQENRFKSKYKNQKPRVLPQGSPCSPFISNLILIKLDHRIKEACDRFKFSFSRYADDITISSKSKDILALSTIKKIIRDEGFTVNINKVLYKRSSSRMEVTGLTINTGVYVRKTLLKKIISHLYYCKKFGVKSHLNKIGSVKSNYKDWLLGNILFINSIEPTKAKILLQQFNEIDFLL